jgi:hypothetical protein
MSVYPQLLKREVHSKAMAVQRCKWVDLQMCRCAPRPWLTRCAGRCKPPVHLDQFLKKFGSSPGQNGHLQLYK